MEPSLVGIKIKTLDNALHEMEVSQEMTVINLKTLIEDVALTTPKIIFLKKCEIFF